VSVLLFAPGSRTRLLVRCMIAGLVQHLGGLLLRAVMVVRVVVLRECGRGHRGKRNCARCCGQSGLHDDLQ
jgi:hypothetical protein